MIRLKYLKDVATVQIDREKCTGCRDCVIVCPQQLLAIENKKAVIVDRDLCMECGACMVNCEPEAITVDYGVGCASAIINGMLSGGNASCESGCNC